MTKERKGTKNNSEIIATEKNQKVPLSVKRLSEQKKKV